MKKIIKASLKILVIYIITNFLITNIAYGIIFHREDISQIYLKDDLEKYSFNIDKINGCYYPVKQPKGLIIVAPGFKTERLNYLAEIKAFIENSYSVVSFDYTGIGSSLGNSIISLSQSIIDLESVVNYFAEQTELDIILYGHSLSGYSCAVLSDNQNVDCVISIAGFDKPIDIMYEYGKKTYGMFADINYPFLVTHDFIINNSYSNISAYYHIDKCHIPVLLVSPYSDDVISKQNSLYEKTYYQKNVYKYSIENKNSTHGYYCYTDESTKYTIEVNNLYHQYLKDNNQQAINDLLSNLDYSKLYIIDQDYMSTILDFLAL